MYWWRVLSNPMSSSLGGRFQNYLLAFLKIRIIFFLCLVFWELFPFFMIAENKNFEISSANVFYTWGRNHLDLENVIWLKIGLGDCNLTQNDYILISPTHLYLIYSNLSYLTSRFLMKTELKLTLSFIFSYLSINITISSSNWSIHSCSFYSF